MSITAFDIKKSAFAQHLEEVDELTLTNRGLIDLGSIKEANNLQVVNLSFNKLQSVQGLAGLSHLSTLNISHNQITSLKGLSTLTSLTHLNASYNKLTSLSPLSHLPALQNLWIQHNTLSEPASLHPIITRTNLQRLCIAPNPLCSKLPENWRSALLRLCTALQQLDAVQVTDEDLMKSKEHVGSEEEAKAVFTSSCRGSTAGVAMNGGVSNVGLESSSIAAVMGNLFSSSPIFNTSRAGISLTSTNSRFEKPPRPRSDARGGGGTPDNTLPASAGRYKSPCGNAILQGGRGRSRSESPGGNKRMNQLLNASPNPKIPSSESIGMEEGHGEGSSQGSLLVSGDQDMESVLSFVTSRSSFTSSTSSRAGTLRPRRMNSTFLPPIRTIPESSAFMAVLSKLPDLDAKVAVAVTATQAAIGTTKRPPIKPPPDGQIVEYECRYPRHAQGRAVTNKRDGSVVSYWPNGDLAVTVDVDYTSAELCPGGEGQAYRLFAMYRHTGNVAASFESGSAGGFVQYPNGNVAMIVNSEGGKTFSPSGEARLKWNCAEILDNSRLSETNNSHGRDDELVVDMYLDSTLGMRYLTAQRKLQLYLCCEGLRYVFFCGPNLPASTWGKDDNSGVQSLYEDAGRVSGNEVLPQPAFLQQLLRESSSAALTSSVRVTSTGQRLLSEEITTLSPKSGTLKSFSSISDSLRALDDSLSTWAADRVTNRSNKGGPSELQKLYLKDFDVER
ncbi:hypothetical protein CEUSTIGMA_g9919.t1 [Chlamydomonas eustigma]|uniref:Uncharacterized protein n=1 Tax=Chlamydomonas eustigma TaxID=1157962 RepID=A0A250XHU2_9CHLO|nr:hypothetical protein CEUSTIGMA_g9919.t1 [Chlamydomonas eustigma]|eukprot:GAX82492.1 hypothetical protein CEUSTIGMA_g9919.t1 [Chlamydomonas eustigma]